MSKNYSDRINILEPYLNMPHIKTFLETNWITISSMNNHGSVLHAIIVYNPHNLIHGPGHRRNDLGRGLDKELLTLMSQNYQDHIQQISDMREFLSLPRPNYELKWQKSGQRKLIKSIFVDLWKAQIVPDRNQLFRNFLTGNNHLFVNFYFFNNIFFYLIFNDIFLIMVYFILESLLKLSD